MRHIRFGFVTGALCFLAVFVDATTSYMYVTDPDAPTVYLVDVTSGVAIETITNTTPRPFSRPLGIAVSPDSRFAYLSDFDNSLFILLIQSRARPRKSSVI